ncbi:MAG TPA: S41 family peptidase [Candidatus Saccharimonas sp.]|nr:S41 family peptidase [Candidatus Saccharimonas sp.]
MVTATDKNALTAGKKKPAKKFPRQVRTTTFIGVAIVVALASFILGSRSQDIAALIWGHNQNSGLPSQLDLSSLQDVYKTLRQNFDGQLDTQKLVDGAKKGLTSAAGDQYTVFFTNAEAKQFQDDLDGKFSGIGAELDKKDNNLIVQSTLDSSPARNAGLQSGDIITKVNDQDTTNWSIDQAVSAIRGDKGTTVKLAIVRGQELKEFSIVRDNIVNPSVTWQALDGGIGYIRISRFADDTAKLSQQAAADLRQKNVSSIILDLRGDGGGYVDAAQSVASLWLKTGGTIVQEKRDNTVIDTKTASGDALLAGLQTVVLIDGDTASASEITAGALHDHGAAKLVGQKSFGKGSVQQILGIPSGGDLKVTIAKWFTPNGVNISKEGIKPDVEIGISPDDISAGRDPQKDKAIDLLKK